jgi:hypothetical protein
MGIDVKTESQDRGDCFGTILNSFMGEGGTNGTNNF